MLRFTSKRRRKVLRYLCAFTVLLLLVAVATVPLRWGHVTSVYSQSDGVQEQPPGEDVVEITDLGGFDFGDEAIDFSRFGDYGQFNGEAGQSVEFDFAGFLAVFQDPQLFETASGNFGDFAGIFGSFEDFSGEFNDFKGFGGDFTDLGGFFNRSNQAVEAYNQARDLKPEDLNALGGDFAYGLIGDLDFFGFHELEADFITELLAVAGEEGDLGVMTAEQWTGALGALGLDGISASSDDLLGTALNGMEDRDFLLLSPSDAAVLFQTAVLEVDQSLGQSLAGNLETVGDDVASILGVVDHDFFSAIQKDLAEIFRSIDFSSLNLKTSALSGDDIGAMLAAMGNALGDQDGEAVSAAIAHLGVGDFDAWSSAAALQVIDSMGLEEMKELTQFESIIGSFRPGEVGLLGPDLANVIGALDFGQHGGLLGGFSEGALKILTGSQLIGYQNTADLWALANSAGPQGVVNVSEGRLGAILTAVGRDDFGMFDADTLGALSGNLSEDILGGYADEFQGAILDTIGANRFGSGGLGFDEISSGRTSFIFLADAAAKEIVAGRQNFSSLVLDGSSLLQEEALEFFGGELFEVE